MKSCLAERQNDDRGQEVTHSLTLFVPILPQPVPLTIWSFFVGVVTSTGSDVTCFSRLLSVADSVSDVESRLFPMDPTIVDEQAVACFISSLLSPVSLVLMLCSVGNEPVQVVVNELVSEIESEQWAMESHLAVVNCERGALLQLGLFIAFVC